MSNKFFDRNKKKSLLGLLFLWAKENRTLSALLLVVALSSFLFIMPAATILSLPGGTKMVAGIAWLASRLGVDTSKWGFLAKGGARSYDDFIAQLRAAKESGSRPAGWGPFFGKPAEDKGPGSLDMVKGRRQDLEGGGYPDGKLPKGKDIDGILTPEDSQNGEEGVSVDEELLAQQRGGFVREAKAGGFAPGSRDLLGFAGRGIPGGAYAGKGMFGDGPSAGSRSKDKVNGALATVDTGKTPNAKVKGASSGRLSQSRASEISKRMQRSIRSRSFGGRSAFGQLADGRGLAAASTTPHCTPPGCPGEFASHRTGAIYDGTRGGANGAELLVTGADDANPTLPDSSVADGYMQEARQMEQDAAKCREMDAKYTDSENAAMAKMQQESDTFENMGCSRFSGGGGCSKSTAALARACGAQSQKITAACQAYADIRNEHTNACPLTAGKGMEQNCGDRAGNMNATSAQSQDGSHVVP